MKHFSDSIKDTIYGERISANMWKDNNGQLICENVVLARTGFYDYRESELIEGGSDEKVVKVYRSPEEVFNPISMKSMNFKPLVNDHPDDNVTPETVSYLQKGFMTNIRRGDGEFSECLMADIIATEPTVIDLIMSGEKRDLSVGYTADIEEKDGRYEMKNIVGNHIALCEAGRAGNAKIRDSKTVEDAESTNLKSVKGDSRFKFDSTYDEYYMFWHYDEKNHYAMCLAYKPSDDKFRLIDDARGTVSKEVKSYDEAVRLIPSGKRLFYDGKTVADANKSFERLQNSLTPYFKIESYNSSDSEMSIFPSKEDYEKVLNCLRSWGLKPYGSSTNLRYGFAIMISKEDARRVLGDSVVVADVSIDEIMKNYTGKNTKRGANIFFINGKYSINPNISSRRYNSIAELEVGEDKYHAELAKGYAPNDPNQFGDIDVFGNGVKLSEGQKVNYFGTDCTISEIRIVAGSKFLVEFSNGGSVVGRLGYDDVVCKVKEGKIKLLDSMEVSPSNIKLANGSVVNFYGWADKNGYGATYYSVGKKTNSGFIFYAHFETEEMAKRYKNKGVGTFEYTPVVVRSRIGITKSEIVDSLKPFSVKVNGKEYGVNARDHAEAVKKVQDALADAEDVKVGATVKNRGGLTGTVSAIENGQISFNLGGKRFKFGLDVFKKELKEGGISITDSAPGNVIKTNGGFIVSLDKGWWLSYRPDAFFKMSSTTKEEATVFKTEAEAEAVAKKVQAEYRRDCSAIADAGLKVGQEVKYYPEGTARLPINIRGGTVTALRGDDKVTISSGSSVLIIPSKNVISDATSPEKYGELLMEISKIKSSRDAELVRASLWMAQDKGQISLESWSKLSDNLMNHLMKNKIRG